MIKKILIAVFLLTLVSNTVFANKALYTTHHAYISNEGTNKYKSIRLTPEIYNNANSDLSDLRIKNNGEDVPYFIWGGSQSDFEVNTENHSMSLINSYTKDDEFYFFWSGSSGSIMVTPITVWQDKKTLFVAGLEKVNFDRMDQWHKNIAMAFSPERTLYYYLDVPYEIIDYNEEQYLRQIWKTSLDSATREIISRVEGAQLADDETREKILEICKKNAVPHEPIYDDAMIITLKTWEDAIAGITPDEWELIGKP